MGSKVSDPNAAISAVTAYQLLPSDLATLVGYGLPFFEIMLGVLLIVGLATRATAITSGVLMVVFIAAVASAWARGLSIDCGCFGGGGETSDPQYLPEILRDLLFLGLASWLAVFPASRFALDRSGWSAPATTASSTSCWTTRTTARRRGRRPDRLRPQPRNPAGKTGPAAPPTTTTE